MSFRDTAKENLWFGLLNYEYERHVRDQLLKGLADGWLDWCEMEAQPQQDKEKYLREQTTPFICLSVRQSKELFTASEQASDATRPLLSYYGMMNLVKAVLAIDIPDYFQDKTNLMHGMTTRAGDKASFKFHEEKVVLLPSGVYSLGRKAVGLDQLCAANERVCVRIVDIFKGLPDLHADYLRLSNENAAQMNTFPFGTPEHQWNQYAQQFYVQTWIDKSLYESVKDRLTVDLEDKFIFEGAGFGQLHLKSKLNSVAFQELAGLLDTFSTMLMTTNARFLPLMFDCTIEGPARVVRSEKIGFTDLELIYILMYYMSTLARYRPHIWEAAISGKETEFVTLFKKFLYYADSKFIALLSIKVGQLNTGI